MSFWQQVFKSTRKRSSHNRRITSSKLNLELLEERCTPATFYVNVNGGSDSNPGTLAAPFASIQEAANVAKQFALGERAPQQDNNTILVAVGTYSNSGLDTDGSNVGFPAVVGVIDQQSTIAGGYNAAFTAVTGQSVIDGGTAIRGVSVVSTSRPRPST